MKGKLLIDQLNIWRKKIEISNFIMKVQHLLKKILLAAIENFSSRYLPPICSAWLIFSINLS
jgi:hypothetical protein